MTFRFGFGGLMTFEESYCVVPVPVASRLVPSFRCTGLLSALKHRNMRKNFAKMPATTDRLLQRHPTPAQPPSPKPSEERRVGRECVSTRISRGPRSPTKKKKKNKK